jgi:ankyrin repeat protein
MFAAHRVRAAVAYRNRLQPVFAVTVWTSSRWCTTGTDRLVKLEALKKKLPQWSDHSTLNAIAVNAAENGALDVVTVVLEHTSDVMLAQLDVATLLLTCAQTNDTALSRAVLHHPRVQDCVAALALPVREKVLLAFIECSPACVPDLLAPPLSIKPSVPAVASSSESERVPLTPTVLSALRVCARSSCSDETLASLAALLDSLQSDDRFDFAELFPALSSAASKAVTHPMVALLLTKDVPPCHRREKRAIDLVNPYFATTLPPFVAACSAGNIGVLLQIHQAMLRRGDLHDIDRIVASGLVTAAQNGHADVVELICHQLLSHPEAIATLRGEGPNGMAFTALQAAAAAGWMPVVRFLLGGDGISGPAAGGLDVCSAEGGSAFELAIRGGRINVVRFFLDAGASPSAPVVRSTGVTPLHVAARANQRDILHYLLAEQRVDAATVALDGFRAFDHAVIAGSLDVVRYFWETRLVPITGPVLDSGATPLDLACEAGQDLVALFLATEAEADFSRCTDDGVTGVHRACAFCSAKIVRFIHRERNVDFNSCRAADGTTPFFWACRFGNLEVVKYLHQFASVDCTIESNDGVSPFFAASKADHVNVVKYLHEEAGIAGTVIG